MLPQVLDTMLRVGQLGHHSTNFDSLQPAYSMLFFATAKSRGKVGTLSTTPFLPMRVC